MLLAGANIRSSADALKKITVEYLYHSIKNPKPQVEALVRQLRIIRNLNAKQYSDSKRQLPYVVCGFFSPPYRRTEHFAYIEYFFVDIDHIESKGLNIKEVRARIEQDKRVHLSFLSPSEDGLKVLFKLKERCYDAGLYSLFYKAFVGQFSMEYQLEQVIDGKTCDVSRACFVSADSQVFYREEIEEVDVKNYLNLNSSTELFDQKRELERVQIKQEPEEGKEEEKEARIVDPDVEVMERIKGLLAPTKQKWINEKSPVYIPEQLNEIMADLKRYIENTGIIVYEVLNIQYAKKIRMRLGTQLAEINLFYGKKGYSVVQSPRGGTSATLNEMMADLVNAFIWENIHS